MHDRINVLNLLLEMNKSLPEIKKLLSQFEWDSNELVMLETKHVKNILECYQSGEINENIVEEWANAVENRDDIGYPEHNGKLIKEVINELANPLLTQKLNRVRAKTLFQKLGE